MILLDNLKNKRIGVLGFGQTGKAIVDSLEASGAKIFLHDDNGINNAQYKKYCADLLNKEIIKPLDAIVISPGIHLFWPAPHKTVSLARKSNKSRKKSSQLRELTGNQQQQHS